MLIAPPAQAEDTPRTATTDPAVINDMLDRMNRLRDRLGLAPYVLNDALNRAAQDQAQWLVDTGIRGHFRPDGSRPSTRASAQGYVAEWCCGENYYMSIDATPDLVWNFWTWSHDHYVNLTNRRFDEVGVGYAVRGVRISYVIVFGDSLQEGGGVSATPVPTTVPVPTSAPVSSAPSSGEYVVQRGDTLFGIATRFGVSTADLAAANGISDPSRIYVGQRLVLPGSASAASAPVVSIVPTTAPAVVPVVNTNPPASSGTGGSHVVAAGENLFRIALRYGVSVPDLMAANNLTNTTIMVGQTLTIPAGGVTNSAAAMWYMGGTAESAPSVVGVAGITAAITSPRSGQVVTDALSITGTVQFTPEQAQGYHFFIQGGAFPGWTPLGVEHPQAVVDGELETLYTPALEPGAYRLRLMVRADGDMRTVAEVAFTVQR